MTTHSTAIDHPDRRLVVTLPRPYDRAREHYETLVPEADLARFFQMASWPATLELAEINAPHGFMRYYRSDITAVMAGSPSLWKATQYLMGNHTIAERMFRHDPSVMLHAPCPPAASRCATSICSCSRSKTGGWYSDASTRTPPAAAT